MSSVRRFLIAYVAGMLALAAPAAMIVSPVFAEDSGKEVKEDTQDVKDSAKDAGKSIKKAAEDTGDTLEKGGKKVGKKLDEFGHDVADFFKNLFD